MEINAQELKDWLYNWLPANLVGSEPEISSDEDEVLIVLNLNTDSLTGEGEARKQAEHDLIERRRNETKGLRVKIGRRVGGAFGLAVSWGMRAGSTLEYFTNNTAPVMTRLTREERKVLDTLIAANVVNTRSSALGYLVRMFAKEHQNWINEVQEALKQVEGLRDKLQPEPKQGLPKLDENEENPAKDKG